MSAVIRFVDRTLTIREELLGFVPCKLGLSGEAIATSIMKFVEQPGLNIQFCRGQGYDGVGNMAGRISGLRCVYTLRFVGPTLTNYYVIRGKSR